MIEERIALNLIRVTWPNGKSWIIRQIPFAVYEDSLDENDLKEIGLAQRMQVPPTSYIQPLMIVSTKCNLKCRYCYASAGSYGGEPVNMEPEVMRAAMAFLERQLQNFSKQNPESTEVQVGSICFGGEPLLNPDVVFESLHQMELLSARLSSTIGIVCKPLTTINTNGTILNDDIRSYFERYQDSIELVVSYDGLFHDRFRISTENQPTSKIVQQNVKTLLAMGMKTSITCCVVPEHMPAVAKTVEHITELFGREIPINLSFIRGSLKGVRDINRFPGRLEQGYTEEMLIDTANTIAGLIGDGYNIFYERFVRRLYEGGYDYRCGACLYECCVMPDGNVYPCHNFIDEQYKLGNVMDKGFEIKPHGCVFDKFVSRRTDLLKPCQNCIFRNVCMSSFDCPSHSEYDLGDFYMVDKKTCEFAKIVQTALLKRFILSLSS